MCVNKAQRFDLNGAKTSDWMSLFDAHKSLLNDFTVDFDNFRIKISISVYDSDKPSLLSNKNRFRCPSNRDKTMTKGSLIGSACVDLLFGLRMDEPFRQIE